MHRFTALFLSLLLIASLGGCARQQPLVKTGFALDTVISIALYTGGSEKTIDAAFALIDELELVFSRTDERSEVWALNHSGGEWHEASPQLRDVLEKAQVYAELSGGRFDVTICPVVDLWNFTGENPAVPDAEALAAALESVDYHNVELDGDNVRLLNGAQVDLGAIAKGYIADCAADFLRANGVRAAIVNLGGNVVTVGKKTPISDFRIGVQQPFEADNRIIGKVKAANSSLVTSGVYERFFKQDGKLYHHILDTKTGMPVNNGLVSVTVITDRSVDGDGLSTVLFALGPEDGLTLAESLTDTEALFITTDGSMIATSGFDLVQ